MTGVDPCGKKPPTVPKRMCRGERKKCPGFEMKIKVMGRGRQEKTSKWQTFDRTLSISKVDKVHKEMKSLRTKKELAAQSRATLGANSEYHTWFNTSMLVQWSRIRLLMQWLWVQSVIRELKFPHSLRKLNCWATTTEPKGCNRDLYLQLSQINGYFF